MARGKVTLVPRSDVLSSALRWWVWVNNPDADKYRPGQREMHNRDFGEDFDRAFVIQSSMTRADWIDACADLCSRGVHPSVDGCGPSLRDRALAEGIREDLKETLSYWDDVATSLRELAVRIRMGEP